MVTLPYPPSANRLVASCKADDTPVAIPPAHGIYVIRNLVNNKFYVGSTVNLRQRFHQHFGSLSNGYHHNPHLQSAWNKYGESFFEFAVIEVVESKEQILVREQEWIDNLGAAEREDCYNFCAQAGSHLGRKRSDETRRKLSVAITGKKHSTEAKQKMREAKLGKKLTEEHKRNVGDAVRGKKIDKTPGYNSYGHRLFTADQVREMRRLKENGWSYSQIEAMFGVSHGSLMKIVRRQTYRDC